MNPTIVILEDDSEMGESLKAAVEKIRTDVEVVVLTSEVEFLEYFDEQKPEGNRDLLKLAILDMRIEWDWSSPVIRERPVDYEDNGGFRKAGLRCAKFLRSHPKFRDVPFVFYAIHPKRDYERELADLNNPPYFMKGEHEQSLYRNIQLVLGGSRPI